MYIVIVDCIVKFWNCRLLIDFLEASSGVSKLGKMSSWSHFWHWKFWAVTSPFCWEIAPSLKMFRKDIQKSIFVGGCPFLGGSSTEVPLLSISPQARDCRHQFPLHLEPMWRIQVHVWVIWSGGLRRLPEALQHQLRQDVKPCLDLGGRGVHHWWLP